MKHASRLKLELEQAIVSGRFAPGDRLDEVSLALRFGVSRTPIREALHQLGAEGLIEIRPRRGAIVSTLSAQRLVEMIEKMAEIEAACGRLAARRMTADDEAAIKAAHQAVVEAANRGDSEAYDLGDRAFHEAIFRASRNGFLAEQAFALNKRLSPYRRNQLRARHRVGTCVAEHEAIVAALIAGDAESAASRLRDHVRVRGERFSDMVLALGAA